jgi:hypothetical protein
VAEQLEIAESMQSCPEGEPSQDVLEAREIVRDYPVESFQDDLGDSGIGFDCLQGVLDEVALQVHLIRGRNKDKRGRDLAECLIH